MQKEKLKRNRLKNTGTFEGKILGIRSPKPDYRLCYFINKALGLNLEKFSAKNTEIKGDTPHNVYKQEFPEDNYRLLLVPNKIANGAEFHMPKYKQMDFLFIMEGLAAEKTFDTYKNQLKQINVVEGVFELPNTHFKPQKTLNLD